MKICGPKLSLCGLIISVWGIIQLVSWYRHFIRKSKNIQRKYFGNILSNFVKISGVDGYVHSVALIEDLPIEEEYHTVEEFYSAANAAYNQVNKVKG